MASRVSAPIKWHGGKSYLASRIIDMMPDHTHYVEPYFGGGAVLFKKPVRLIDGYSEVVNDVYGELVAFFRVLQSEDLFPVFERRMIMAPFAQTTWNDSCECNSRDLLDRACAFFIKYRQSRQGLGKDFATLTRARTRRGMNEQVSSWLSAVDGLHDAHSRLKRVVIHCEDALSVIRRQDSARSFFYCDPPYLKTTRVVPDAYSREMDDGQHGELLDLLGSIRGKFLLSGYRSQLYDDAAERFHWRRVDIAIDNKASGAKVKPIKTECVWSNYDPRGKDQ